MNIKMIEVEIKAKIENPKYEIEKLRQTRSKILPYRKTT